MGLLMILLTMFVVSVPRGLPSPFLSSRGVVTTVFSPCIRCAALFVFGKTLITTLGRLTPVCGPLVVKTWRAVSGSLSLTFSVSLGRVSVTGPLFPSAPGLTFVCLTPCSRRRRDTMLLNMFRVLFVLPTLVTMPRLTLVVKLPPLSATMTFPMLLLVSVLLTRLLRAAVLLTDSMPTDPLGML